jgi:hypothetical protein
MVVSRETSAPALVSDMAFDLSKAAKETKPDSGRSVLEHAEARLLNEPG